MRVKQLWTYVPIPAQLKLFYDRVTLTRITTIYFLFSLLHCIVQTAFQVKAFTINAAAFSFLQGIQMQGKIAQDGFPVLGADLRICVDLPTKISAETCPQWWDGTSKGNNTVVGEAASAIISSASFPTTTGSVAPSPSSVVSIPAARPGTVIPEIDSDSDDSSDSESDDDVPRTRITKRTRLPTKRTRAATAANVDNLRILATGGDWVEINGSGFDNKKVNLDQGCLAALRYPVMVLANTKREDIVFITFQAWVLGMSIVAILNESIPHIIASLATHVLATFWAAFQITHTAKFRAEFIRLTVQGACMPMNLLPTYWQERREAEIPSLAFNAVGLIVSAYLTWRLVQLFGWQTFKRVGASLRINRIYKVVLTMSIVLQLAIFFIIASLALWIDQLWNSPLGRMADRALLYQIMFTIALVLTVPWFVMGWIAIRREMRGLMAGFLALSILYLVSWGVMFLSTTYRWTFFQWRFFSLITTASLSLTVITFILAVVCRINFGHDLAKYLSNREPLPGHDFVPAYAAEKSDIESKDTVYFPNEKAVPTFSAAFGSSNEIVPPSQMQFGARPGPFASQRSPVSPPMRAMTRPVSSSSSTQSMLKRHDSDRSARSFESATSDQKQRWVIE